MSHAAGRGARRFDSRRVVTARPIIERRPRTPNREEGRAMRVGMPLPYRSGFMEAVEQVVALEAAGLDVVWVAEAYRFDAPTQLGYLAARTRQIRLGSGILPIYSRTP